MGRYLDMLGRLKAATVEHGSCDISDISDQTPCDAIPFGRLNRFCRALRDLERHCPDYVDVADWQRMLEDGRRFLVQWGEAAERLNWTVEDLFGLHDPPENPDPRYRRLSRYDATGLIWNLHGREVTMLTERTAAIATPGGGSVTYYRRTRTCDISDVSDQRVSP
jgi:hypothetical protein